MTIATGYASLKLYDEPLQKWLKGKYLQKKQIELVDVKMTDDDQNENYENCIQTAELWVKIDRKKRKMHITE